ncbi:Gfo/Idh/MocA family protein [Aidingimonas lacisalsi]|uniref:Gfo/Idh/MocA family protein n=1 Tax=Aidingimonas lacisalsi TaxID=2604086 RepID=UPI0011D26592|nr:Gfo/Idh/MocA family oxidoreductase [Aidingimonas lacisalsi]
MQPINIALVGFGKIAQDQHLPAIQADPNYRLVAIADPHSALSGIPNFPSLEALLDNLPELDAIALCTPPQMRHYQACQALAAGKHVMLEKPPGATLSEVEDIKTRAIRAQRSLFASWHSRYAPAVGRAASWLAEHRVERVEIEWKEDVRYWHPGQTWLWEPGGMGVFDPGINALSIATAILPRPFFLREASLSIPENCQTPIAASLSFGDASGTPIQADFDFLQTGPQTWDIHADTSGGRMTLAQGGSQLSIDGDLKYEGEEREYPGLYERFAELIRTGRSDVDVTPLRHVADSFLNGRRRLVAPFSDHG